jgi:phenylpropionate dioxygenase-like ring-hydroxylating dioxygenase large terminal subunit
MLRNYWYIACASSRLDSKPYPARVLDYDLVVFRDGTGKPAALLDRCRHRGVQLSLGQIVEGTLACGYHGWRYDSSGKCVHIPSLCADQRIPKGCEVPSVPCVEQDGYIWVWIGDEASPPTVPPSIPEFEQLRWSQGSIPMRCDFIKGIENNLDWCHPYFAHPWTHGQFFSTHYSGFKETAYEIRLMEKGMIVFAPPTASEDEAVPKEATAKLSFELPDCVCVEFPMQNGRMLIAMHLVPTGVNTCRLEWLSSRSDEGEAHIIWSDDEPEIFKQDRLLIESAQFTYEKEGDAFERSVEADAATLLARQIVKLAGEEKWENSRSSLRQRRIVRVRA